MKKILATKTTEVFVDKDTYANKPAVIESKPTVEEEILFETQYQTTLLEMGGM